MGVKLLLFICLNFTLHFQDDDFAETLANTYLVANKSNTGITKIIIDTQHKKIKVWEGCVPKDCDWGIVSYKKTGDILTAWYTMGDIKKHINLNLKRDDLIMEAEIKYYMDEKIIKTVNYQLKSQKNRLK
ncbi:hypothetical protein I5M32_06355 [Pedobacter sp. SD-b]|uniref:NlpE N-terminal domain-containing protein n=1 Tax=Pedobacter segetis TaxID=2793069 RepID=A0ABS1BI63_9SPHI|nr:hypothetical protein [Pedobacter segetis]MBK0382580.1 hypothetical protein [Pedobacter segetis]